MRKIKFFIFTKSLGLYINLLSFVSPKHAKEFAYALFSKPRDGKLKKESLPEMLLKAHHETITLREDTIQTYTWKGNGAVILLAHGWDSNSWRWERLLPFLVESGSTVVAIDAPDHGLSQGNFSLPKYAEFIHTAAQKFKPDYLIGHSIGGAASLFYQHKYQNDNLQKLVILGAPAELSSIVANYVGLLSLNKRSQDLLNAYFVENFNFHPNDFSARIFGKTLSLKGLVVHDTQDNVVKFEEAKRIPEAWTQALFHETSGLGHSMHDDELYAKIAAFLFEA
ncbi:MAG: alpha/beta fold hydrolase [Flavobacterium sp.]|uniref:alpha/beta fold hydrolase n=1 Tax=Flavobacterium sp. TaxID=239 RepID=UPI00120AAE44|nr:alpha/beta fold hydrolase [Flavobacterium sp.]RZJ67096.1 MAG: alpha/beta fold hydrolase [Flavobacterium sp.]